MNDQEYKRMMSRKTKHTKEYEKLNDVLTKIEEQVGAKLRAMEPWKLD